MCQTMTQASLALALILLMAAPAGADNANTTPPPPETCAYDAKPAPGSPCHTARLRRKLVLEQARRQAGGLGQSARRARDLLEAAGGAPGRPVPPLTGQITPRLVDSDPVYQQALARVMAETNASRQANGVTRTKISFGEPAVAGSYPEVVALVKGGGKEPWCTGTLLTSDTVLTAAHCLCDDHVPDAVVFGHSTSDVPEERIFKFADARAWSSVKWKSVSSSVSSSDCRKSIYGTKGSRFFGKDIAVIKLAKEVPSTVSNRFASFATRMQRHAFTFDTHLKILGFGNVLKFEDGKEVHSPGTKMIGQTWVLNPDCRETGTVSDGKKLECGRNVEFVSTNVDQSSNGPASSLCKGDSGGPAFAGFPKGTGLSKDADILKEWLIMGVNIQLRRVPGGIGQDPNCGDLGIYTLLTEDKLKFIAKKCKELGGTGCPMFNDTCGTLLYPGEVCPQRLGG